MNSKQRRTRKKTVVNATDMVISMLTCRLEEWKQDRVKKDDIISELETLSTNWKDLKGKL